MTGFIPAFPLALFDEIMPLLSPNEWKIFSFIYRRLVGFGKNSDKFSYSQIQTGTGIKGKATINKCIKSLNGPWLIVTGTNGRSNLLTFSLAEKVQKMNSLETKRFNNCTFPDLKGSIIEPESPQKVQLLNTQYTTTINNTTTTAKPLKGSIIEPFIESENGAGADCLKEFQLRYGSLEGASREKNRQDYLRTIKSHGSQLVSRALYVAWVERDRGPDWSPSWSYVKGILASWQKKGGPENDNKRPTNSRATKTAKPPTPQTLTPAEIEAELAGL
ncbi:MAG: replication protein [Chloroflexi bacterium]|nr:replication protein [Chloroflexota bacterium]